MIETATNSLQGLTSIPPEILSKGASTLLIIFALWLLHTLAVRFINRQAQSPRTLYNWSKVTQYVVVTLGVFLVGRTWLVGMESVITYLGLLSAGIAIALQDLVINLAGWGFIIWIRPFSVGDRIQIGDHAGDVIDIRLFQFSLLEIGKRIDAEQTTGRVLHLPNGIVFKEVFANYSQGFPYIWNEIPILVTYESDWQKAKTLLEQIISRHASDVSEEMKKYANRTNNRFVITYGTTSPFIYTKIESSGVLLTIRYLVAPRQRRNSENGIYEDILRSFAEHWDIDFAYETTREFNHFREGKKPPITPAEAKR